MHLRDKSGLSEIVIRTGLLRNTVCSCRIMSGEGNEFSYPKRPGIARNIGQEPLCDTMAASGES